MDTVKNTRVADGKYQFTYKGKTVEAERQPDLYFIIILGGTKHKGYLKDLKAKFAAFIDGIVVAEAPATGPGETQAKAVPRLAPSGPLMKHRFWIRRGKANGRFSKVTEVDVFAVLSNAQTYPDVRAAMASASKDQPLGNDYAFYWPE